MFRKFRRGRPFKGQALVELAILLPVLLFLLLGALDLGRVFYSQITITNAAKEGALLASQGGSFVANTACSATNTVMCRVLNEAKGGFVEVDPATVSQIPATSPACPKTATAGSTVSVVVNAPFQLLTPFVGAVFGGQNLTVGATAKADCATFPVGLAAATPTPTPTGTPTPTATPTATPPSCLHPVALFSWAADPLINKGVNFADLSSDMSAPASPNVQVAVCVAAGCSPSLPAGHVKVDIGAFHQNGFAAVVGQATWQIGVTATAVGWSQPDTATGALPLLLPASDFPAPNDVALPIYSDPSNPWTWTHGTSTAGDAPADQVSVAWTNFQLSANVDTSRVANIIDGSLVVSVTAQFNDYLGQHNDGQHAALFGDIAAILPADGSGMDFAVPIVSIGGAACTDGVHTDGCFLGWATIHIISASQSAKSITGYFVSKFSSELTYSGGCTLTTCPKNVGSYSLALTN
jgi:Flp pilus assembly protein TadG